MHVCAQHAFLVPVEAGREPWIPWSSKWLRAAM